MKLLLDTHTFLWFIADDRRLGRKAKRRIEDARNESFLSLASVWEMAIKVGIGKLRLVDSLEDVVDRGARDSGIALLPITKAHVLAVASLPELHHDPFDRLLAVQAKHEAMTIVARDPCFDAYRVPRVW